jgi:hypothetical protein
LGRRETSFQRLVHVKSLNHQLNPNLARLLLYSLNSLRAMGGEYVFLPFVTNALALGWVSDLIGTVLKKANLSKGRDAKLPV